MTLELDEDQARDLLDALDMRTKELLQQIDKAFDRAFRAELQKTYERLERLRLQLEEWSSRSAAPSFS